MDPKEVFLSVEQDSLSECETVMSAWLTQLDASVECLRLEDAAAGSVMRHHVCYEVRTIPVGIPSARYSEPLQGHTVAAEATHVPKRLDPADIRAQWSKALNPPTVHDMGGSAGDRPAQSVSWSADDFKSQVAARPYDTAFKAYKAHVDRNLPSSTCHDEDDQYGPRRV